MQVPAGSSTAGLDGKEERAFVSQLVQALRSKYLCDMQPDWPK
jgi:hypothetical protein